MSFFAPNMENESTVFSGRLEQTLSSRSASNCAARFSELQILSKIEQASSSNEEPTTSYREQKNGPLKNILKILDEGNRQYSKPFRQALPKTPKLRHLLVSEIEKNCKLELRLEACEKENKILRSLLSQKQQSKGRFHSKSLEKCKKRPKVQKRKSQKKEWPAESKESRRGGRREYSVELKEIKSSIGCCLTILRELPGRKLKKKSQADGRKYKPCITEHP